MAYFLSMLVSGLKLGSIYAIVAIGYSIKLEQLEDYILELIF